MVTVFTLICAKFHISATVGSPFNVSDGDNRFEHWAEWNLK
jgi:hypothetical protein